MMGTFIISFIGNSFVESMTNSKLLHFLKQQDRRKVSGHACAQTRARPQPEPAEHRPVHLRLPVT